MKIRRNEFREFIELFSQGKSSDRRAQRGRGKISPQRKHSNKVNIREEREQIIRVNKEE